MTTWQAFALAHTIVAMGLFIPIFRKTYYGSGRWRHMKFSVFILSLVVANLWSVIFLYYTIFGRKK